GGGRAFHRGAGRAVHHRRRNAAPVQNGPHRRSAARRHDQRAVEHAGAGQTGPVPERVRMGRRPGGVTHRPLPGAHRRRRRASPPPRPHFNHGGEGMPMEVWILQLFNAVSVSSILLLVALGLSVTFGLMNVINMAHGELIMIGAYTAYITQHLFLALAPPSMFDWYF